MASAPDVSVVVPVLNEEETLRALLDSVRATLDTAERSFEIIFVDDGSTDASFEVIRSLNESDPRVKAIRFRGNFGKSAALAASGECMSNAYSAVTGAKPSSVPGCTWYPPALLKN